MDRTKLKAIDLFAGVGGLSLGAARAGMDLVLAVESDPQALAAHKSNFRKTQHLSADIASMSGQELLTEAGVAENEPFALIGGPPCQGFSLIGRRSIEDPRNNLFVKFFELVRESQPVLFLAENVPGIMTSEIDELRELAFDNVRNDYKLMSPIKVIANEFGAPTKRCRYLFIGYKESFFSQITEDSFKGSSRRVMVKEALQGLPPSIHSSWQTEEQSWRKVTYPKSNSIFWKSVRGNIPDGVGHPDAINRLVENSLISGCLGTKHHPDVVRRFSSVKQGKSDKVSKARRLEWDGYCPTIRAGTGSDRGSYQAVRPLHPTANRVITPREAARLQGFPDWFQFSPTKWHSFRQIGNSVCPTLAEAVFRIILKHYETQGEYYASH